MVLVTLTNPCRVFYKLVEGVNRSATIQLYFLIFQQTFTPSVALHSEFIVHLYPLPLETLVAILKSTPTLTGKYVDKARSTRVRSSGRSTQAL